MHTNKKITQRRQANKTNKSKRRQANKTNKSKRRQANKQTKRRQANKQTKRRQGGMLRQVGTPVLAAVKTIGTEYAKDQAQKIVTGKRNVLGDITNTYKNKSPITPIMSRTNSNSILLKSNNKYTENENENENENVSFKLTPTPKTNSNTNNKNVKPIITLTNNYSDFEF